MTASAESIQDARWKRKQLRRRSPTHPVVVSAFSPLAGWVASLHPSPNTASVLDVGCGNGFLTVALQSHFGRVTGTDYSHEMLEINPCDDLVQASATNLPFPDKSFDVVCCCHLLHHLPPRERPSALNEMTRIARHVIAAIEPNRNNPLMLALALVKPEERMALRFSSSYMKSLFATVPAKRFVTKVDGWITPNRTPLWALPLARTLQRTPMNRIGVDICCAGWLEA